jgi:integrase
MIPDPNDNDLAALASMQVRPIRWTRFRKEVLATYTTTTKKTTRAVERTFRELEAINLADDGEEPRTIQTTADLTMLLVASYFASIPLTLSAHTRRNRLGAVRTLCSIAEQNRYIAISPFRLKKMSKWVRLPRVLGGKRHNPMEEIRAVLDLMKVDTEEKRGWAQWRARRLYALTALVAYSGARAGEAQRMWASDLDIANRIIHIQPHEKHRLKTAGSEQPIAMPAALALILSDWLSHRRDRPEGFELPADLPWLFPGATGRGPWTGGSAGHRPRCRLQAVAARAGVAHITWQMLRRSWATHAEALGVPEGLITRQMRHADPEVTRRYYRQLDMDNLSDATEGFHF